MSEDLEEQQPEENANIRNLRDKAKKADEAEARAAAAERELAFAKAGIPLNDPRSGYFLKGYDGDTSPEAIKAEWDTHFAQPASTTPAIPDSEVAAHQRVASAAEGAAPSPLPTYDDELRSKVASGELRDAHAIANFLRERNPDMVSFDGPTGEFSSLR